MKMSRIVGLFAIASAAVVAGQASADNCKSPQVKIVNDKSETIKVSKIQYFEDCNKTWRTESVTNSQIEHGHYVIYRDNLEYAEGCKITKFKLYRAVRQQTGSAYGPYEWGGELYPEEGSPVCKTNVLYTIRAHD